MQDVDNTAPGIFSPEDVQDMRAELERGDTPAENTVDREGRARAILIRKEVTRVRAAH